MSSALTRLAASSLRLGERAKTVAEESQTIRADLKRAYELLEQAHRHVPEVGEEACYQIDAALTSLDGVAEALHTVAGATTDYSFRLSTN